jgi:glucose-6-phosphate 1-dehydrogenase
MIRMDSLQLIIFGITGNLVQKYILQALYDMAEKGLLPENLTVVGNARKPKSEVEFQEYLSEVLHADNLHHKHPIDPAVFKNLASKISYIDGNLDDPDFYVRLKEYLVSVSNDQKVNRIFYLATYPELYRHVFENLKSQGLNTQDQGYVRLMIEKPFGHDLKSAQDLNKLLKEYFTEDQIYRMDHYLGKETLQNILTFRFGNGVFEPLMNNQYVDHIQITASEDFGIGKRGGYYDSVGALKDVGQNHQLQMLAFATMDAPAEFANHEVTSERIKILQNLMADPSSVVFGQYQDYTQEENVDPTSQTETFYALKAEIDTPRWKGVPIYIRAGKKLKQTATEIAVVFKLSTNQLFKDQQAAMEPNVLFFRIQPNEGIVMRILTKKPGHGVELEPTYMQFCYRQDPTFHTFPDPYEKLISDAIRGDQTFFNAGEEAEAQWAFIDPLSLSKPEVHSYEPGSWGPEAADRLIEKDGRKWLEPSEQFCVIVPHNT